VSNSGSPKNTSAPWPSSAEISRRMTPAVADDSPPIALSSGLPSSEVRNMSSSRRSLRSSSGSPARSAYANTSPSDDSWVSLRPRTLLSSSGPNDSTVARNGTPVPCPPSA